MKILHLYVDKAQNWEYCKKTFEVIEALRETYGIESVCLDGNDDYDYWKVLRGVWGQDDLLTIEQDIVFTEAQLNEIIKCRQKDCAFAFKLYRVTTALDYVIWSVGENILPYQLRNFREDETPKFCNFASLGFTKLSKETQLKVSLDVGSPVHWKFVDMWTVGRIPDAKIHVHYEVEHAHVG